MIRRDFLWSGAAVALLAGTAAALRIGRPQDAHAAETFEVTKTEAEWRAILSDAAFNVLRKEGTEYPGTSPLLNEHRKGIFACAGCDLPLYS
ncbi:MAG: peptide-methionine (R)-S-oxide reductase, partial [Mesorhizobium sp.]